MTDFQPTLPPEIPFTEAELVFVDDSPPDLFPENQNSNFGLIRRILSDFIQELIDQQQTIYNERFVTTSTIYLDEHELQVGLPVGVPGKTIEQRRAEVLSRYARGPFTRTRRRQIVEKYISATFGTPLMLSPTGIPLTAAGLPIYAETSSVVASYKIVENISGFSYVVRIISTTTPDLASLTRELNRLTPAGISFTITSVPDPFTEPTPYGGIPSLTLSGNEITDATRAAGASLPTTASGQMLDGRMNDSSVGIRRAATNQFSRGQCDTVGNWITLGAGTVSAPAIDATTPPPFSPQSIKFVTGGTAAQEAGGGQSNPGLAMAAGVIAVGSIYFKGVAGASYGVRLRVRDAGGASSFGTTTTFIATGAWQLLVPLSMPVPAGVTGDRIVVEVYVNGTRAETFWLAHPMMESGQSAVASYVATSGGVTATHPAGRVQISTAVLNPVQSWFAIRMRPQFTLGTNGRTSGIFAWANDANNFIESYISSAGSVLVSRKTGGVQTSKTWAPNLSTPAGTPITVAGYWTAPEIAVSVGGAPFQKLVDGNTPPALTAPLADIGSIKAWLANTEFDSDVIWFICGKGVLTDADAATLNALADTDPAYLTLPSGAQVSAIWPAVDSTFRVPV